jgi:hypothetical protein
VGAGSSHLQLNLYKSCSGSTAEATKEVTFQELDRACSKFRGRGEPAPCRDACLAAAELYYNVQLCDVKRSNEKWSILGACLWLACIERKVSFPHAKIAEMVGLSVKGLANGLKQLSSYASDRLVPVDVNVDPTDAEICTLFGRLGLAAPKYDGLRLAVADVVRTAVASHIGISSLLRTKVAGATFAVLQRCRDPSLLLRPPTAAEFCQDRGPEGSPAQGATTRKNTIDAFTAQLAEYHSYFAPCYLRAGLDAAPPAAPGPRRPRAAP